VELAERRPGACTVGFLISRSGVRASEAVAPASANRAGVESSGLARRPAAGAATVDAPMDAVPAGLGLVSAGRWAPWAVRHRLRTIVVMVHITTGTAINHASSMITRCRTGV